MDALNIFMRFLHILSAIALAGGALAWRFAVIPATEPLSSDTRGKVGDAIARAWRPFVLTAIAGLLISGTYNFLRKTNPAARLPCHLRHQGSACPARFRRSDPRHKTRQ